MHLELKAFRHPGESEIPAHGLLDSIGPMGDFCPSGART